ncbi:MAG: c-type cytochrome [Steroidobacteraceae bacterium]
MASLLACAASVAWGQAPATFPAQQRKAGDPVLIERGGSLYGLYCRACHGADLRGGDMGGPNLLRSQVVLNDISGEQIGPVVRNGRVPAGGGTAMPPLPLPDADISAVAEYIHSVVSTAQPQGAPPRGKAVELNLLVGNVRRGQRYFKAECASCHSVSGDLAGIGARLTNIGQLQDSWVAGRRVGPPAGDGSRRIARVTVKFADGTQQSGRVARLDDFVVSFTSDDGEYHSYLRRSTAPQLASVQVEDPLQQHRVLWTKLSDQDMHDVTAYLAGVK